MLLKCFIIPSKNHCGFELPSCLQLGFSEDLKMRIQDKIKDLKRPLIAIGPGGANDSERQGRIWPTENWIKLGNELAQKYGATILIVGSKAEKNYRKKLTVIENSILFPGELALDENAVLLSECDIVLRETQAPRILQRQ